MRIFVSGAAGFVGSRLSKALLDRGDTVLGHDNFDPYYAREHKTRHLRDLTPNPPLRSSGEGGSDLTWIPLSICSPIAR